MAEPFATWHAEHVNFARLLDLLEIQVAAFHRGERPNYDLMGDIVYYLRSFADCVHHPRENVAFARLAEREPGMAVVIDRLQQQHRVIATAGDELFNRLNEATGDVMTPRAALEAAAALSFPVMSVGLPSASFHPVLNARSAGLQQRGSLSAQHADPGCSVER
jgi:hemerythrin-like domain-containing protein